MRLRERLAALSSVQRQGLRFVAVGLVNTAFGYGLFALLVLVLGDRVPYLVLLPVSFAISTFQAYLLSRRFVFGAEGRFWRQFVRFASVYAVAFGINLVALPVLVELVHLPVLVAQAVVLAVIPLATFTAHRTFTFRQPQGTPTVQPAAEQGHP